MTDIRVGTQTVSVDLDALGTRGGTLRLNEGALGEATTGQRLRGGLPGNERTRQHNATRLVLEAIRREYGVVPSTAEGLTRIRGTDIPRLVNRARLESFMGKMQSSYGVDARDELTRLRGSVEFRESRAVDETFLAASRQRIEDAEATGLALIGGHLRSVDMPVDQIMGVVRAVPRFHVLLAGANPDGKTLGEHSQAVMSQFESQKAHYNLPGLQTSMRAQQGFENFNAERFMKVVIALHDIGKNLAPDSASQHEFTVPILRDAMQKMGFPEREVRLAVNLVDNELLGDWQVGRTHEVGEVRKGLRALAQDSGVSLRDYLTMQKLFYISDASAYEPIRTSFMTAGEDGKLRFNSGRTGQVLDSFATQHGALGTTVRDLLLSPAALAEGKTHPLNLFSADISATGHNVYDLARLLAGNKTALEEAIAGLEPATLRPTATARLKEALEMSAFALKLDADHWTPEHARGVVLARMDIRAAGITALLPRSLSATNGTEAYFGNLNGLDGLRGPGGVSDRFYDLVDARGGSSKLLQTTGQLQVKSSWCPTSMAIKGYLMQSRAVDEGHFYTATSDQHGPVTIKAGECYDKFAHAPGAYWDTLSTGFTGGTTPLEYIDEVMAAETATKGAIGSPRTADTSLFDTSIRYQMAMQLEMLAHFDFPGNDPEAGTVRLYRVEAQGVLAKYGIENEGDTGVMRRGAADSSSIICPVMGSGGADVTETVVPHHRVINSFFLSALHSAPGDGPQPKLAGTSVLMGNEQREVLFMSDGLETTFTGDGQKICSDFMKVTTTIGTPPPPVVEPEVQPVVESEVTHVEGTPPPSDSVGDSTLPPGD